jgi:hypothetical protein
LGESESDALGTVVNILGPMDDEGQHGVSGIPKPAFDKNFKSAIGSGLDAFLAEIEQAREPIPMPEDPERN